MCLIQDNLLRGPVQLSAPQVLVEFFEAELRWVGQLPLTSIKQECTLKPSA